jgi:hypothetical protein
VLLHYRRKGGDVPLLRDLMQSGITIADLTQERPAGCRQEKGGSVNFDLGGLLRIICAAAPLPETTRRSLKYGKYH